MFQTKWAKDESLEKEKENKGESMTKIGSYIDAHKQIQSMMIAGQRLQIARSEQFDKEVDGKIPLDPRRKLYYEKIESVGLIRELEQKLQETTGKPVSSTETGTDKPVEPVIQTEEPVSDGE